MVDQCRKNKKRFQNSFSALHSFVSKLFFVVARYLTWVGTFYLLIFSYHQSLKESVNMYKWLSKVELMWEKFRQNENIKNTMIIILSMCSVQKTSMVASLSTKNCLTRYTKHRNHRKSSGAKISFWLSFFLIWIERNKNEHIHTLLLRFVKLKSNSQN